jgi:hypothetical protein
MDQVEFNKQIEFGLENLERVYKSIKKFSSKGNEADVTQSALAYECVGYYNAIEHLMVRFLKYLQIEIPTGAFFHRETIHTFERAVFKSGIDSALLKAILDLMAFRHVAVNIYGFLLDQQKLQRLIDQILNYHTKIKQLFVDATDRVAKIKPDP